MSQTHSNKGFKNPRVTTQLNKFKANSLLDKANLHCTKRDQNDIDLKENLNSVWLSTELDDIDICLTENSINLSTELKQTSTVNDEVKAKGLILWPESQPSALKNQKGHPVRQVISCVLITHQMKTLNRKLSHYHFHLSSCSVLLTVVINSHCTYTLSQCTVDKRTDSSEKLSAKKSRCSNHFIIVCCLSEAVKKIKTCDNSLCDYKPD